jgi:hypothetical protein
MRIELLVLGLLGLAACQRELKPGAEVSPGVVLIDAVGHGPGRVELLRKRLDDRRGESTVTVAGRIIYGPTDRVIGVVAAVPSRERPAYLLLEVDYGAPACRLWYRVIDLRGDRPLVTEDFGNCWRLSAPPAEDDGALRLQLFAERSGGSVVDFSYRDGVVAEVPGSTRPAGQPTAGAPPAPSRP